MHVPVSNIQAQLIKKINVYVVLFSHDVSASEENDMAARCLHVDILSNSEFSPL